MARGTHHEILESGALDPGELLAICRRAERATAGPWKFWLEGRNHEGGDDFLQTAGEDLYVTGATVDDRDCIANARQDVPKLIAEIERLQRLVELLKQGRG